MESQNKNCDEQQTDGQSESKESFKTPTLSHCVTDIRGKDKHEEKPPKSKILSENSIPESDQKSDRIGPIVSNKNKSLSPAEQLKQNQVAIPYKEPPWGGITEEKYSFDVLKNGTITDNIDITEKSFYVFGRLPSCDVTMEHPSLSRYHAIVQYCKNPTDQYEKGWYLFDLDSTHGTWLNKRKIQPKTYYRIRVGHVLKFGGSTRLNILQGPEWDNEDESELTVTEMKQQKERQKKELELLRQAELLNQKAEMKPNIESKEDSGCLWGMEDDAVDETEENPFASDVTPENEKLYIDDPKKALKGFFEREGYDPPEYEIVDAGRGKYRCSVELPVDTPSGEPLVAEATVSAKKKEAVVACALEACRVIDKMGLLRASKHESRKRKAKDWEQNDFYDSDEDTYLDRTGTIEKKREFRMKKVGKADDKKAESYDNLLKQHEDVVKEIESIEQRIADAKAQEAAMESDDVDALDAYMLAIKSGVMDTKTRMKLKRQLIELRKEEQRLRKYVNLAKPSELPTLKMPDSKIPPKDDSTKQASKVNPFVGKMKGFDTQNRVPKHPVVVFLGECHLAFSHKVEQDRLCRGLRQDIGTVANDDDDDNFVVEEDEDEEQSRTETSHDLSRVQCLSSATDDKSKKTPDKTSKQTVKFSHSSKNHSRNPTVPQDLIKDREKNLESKIWLKEKVKRTKTNVFEDKPEKLTSEYDKKDPNYAAWFPPQGQSGDGKTHLNAKFGY